MSAPTHVPQDLLAHSAFVRRLARSLLADGHAAEDVAQEAWTRSVVRPPQRGGDLRAWLRRVVRNLAYQRRRAEAHRDQRERESARPEALLPAEAGLERAETLQRVVDAVRALEEPYRATILARFYEDLPPRAIAARDGVPVETVSSRLKRGLAQVRARLERGERDSLAGLALLAGESPCLPAAAVGSVAPAILAGCALLAGLGAWWIVAPGEPRAAREVASTSAESGAGVLALPPAVAQPGRESVAASATEPVLSGRVRDESGAPVPEACVHVLGVEDPFGPAHPAPRIGWNAYLGRTFDCDAGGAWRAVLPRRMRVFVVLEWTELLEEIPVRGEGRWVEAPAEGIDFVVRRIPSATLEVRVFEGAAHRPLADFSVHFCGPATVLADGSVSHTGGFSGARAEDGVARRELAVRDPAGRKLRVVLDEPEVGSLRAKLGLAPGAQPEQEVLLLPGEREEVVFTIPERGVARGMVVDGRGTPVPDALVFFGEETRARGDEPFKPLRMARIRDGARTGADGWFELRGEGAQITAVHAELSGATVALAQSGRIVLGERGAVRGRLAGIDGRPSAGIELRLDQRRDGPAATTDAAGRFEFEGVERGAHALWAGGEWPLACVRLAAGEEVELELAVRAPRTLLLAFQPPPGLYLGEPSCALIGRDVLFDVRWSEAEERADPGMVRVDAPRPGAYWFVTDRGLAAPVVLGEGDERVDVELGTTELVVRGAANRVQVVPADADPFLRLFAARVPVELDPEQGARFLLAPGRYALVGEAGAVLRTLELPPEGLAVTLE